MTDEPDKEFNGDELGDSSTSAAKSALLRLMGNSADSDDDEQFATDTKSTDPPLYWPRLNPAEAAGEWRTLYAWVVTLQHRFRGMVRLPPCWYRHNDLVEALSALRDHERASYADIAKPTAAVTWHTAFRDIEARLRVWIAELRCGGDPDYHDPAVHAARLPDTTPPHDLDNWIAEDQKIRNAAATRAAQAIASTPPRTSPRSRQ